MSSSHTEPRSVAPQARPRRWRSERGAVMVHVAFAFLGLTAFSSFVVDYGVLWSARRQAQNAADAAAMAAASSLGFVDATDQGLARTAALNAAAVNLIWGQPPDITAGDITFPPCPVGSPGVGTNTCVQVNVFRNQRAGGSPLPTIMGGVVGIANQGVRATATAEVIYGTATNCVKPFAIADKWTELRNNNGPPDWDETDDFERYVQNGNNAGTLLAPADLYTPPTTGNPGNNGTGFDVTIDYGQRLVLKSGNPNQALQPGWYSPVVINPGCVGGNCYRDAIAQCAPNVIRAGDVLTMEPGNMIGPTNQGITDLIAPDPRRWVNGEITGTCTGTSCTRVVAIPVFNPDLWDLGPSNGRSTVVVTRVVGMFIDRIQGNDVTGYLVPYPSAAYSGTGGVAGSSFVVSIVLVR